MTVTTYPAGPITPHGQYYRDSGRYPTVHLASHDGSVEFYLHGGESIPWPDRPEVVRLTKGGIKSLIAPWKIVGQKGATEDGETFIDALHDPAELELTVEAIARDPRRLQSLVAELLGSIDKKRTSPLTVVSPTGERWWSGVRWNKTPAEPFSWGESRKQKLTLRLRIDGALWRSEADISGLGFQYDRHIDEFDYTVLEVGVDEGWDVAYVGGHGGHVSTSGGELIWTPPTNPEWLAEERSGIMRHRTHRAADDDMIAELLLGGYGTGLPFPGNAANGIWARMNNSGTPGQDGIRALVELHQVRLTKFVGGSEFPLTGAALDVQPQNGDLFELICAGSTYTVRRNGRVILTHLDTGPQNVGPNYRSAGLEMHAGATILWMATTPAPVARWALSSNNTAPQAGQIQCLNIGSEPMYRTYTLVGPGTFNIGVAPGSDDMISMGPLLENQVVYLRTDPRKTTITDLTAKPPTPQQLNDWQQAVKDFLDFATGGNAPPLMHALASQFGIQPPQGNLYSLLKGRFGTDSAIPPAPVSGEAQPYYINASITDGDANSQLISTGIPLRQYPLR
ncbi:DUF7257 domain-containing protein [Mycolicibacter algericus]|uniref:DUF7257 domain-containing protein n=2 Tax=Mycolicibacter algericus TaxID=1288388 RepID=A0A7I9Y4J2_MYCAL|nr:hypothetical protein [Mycolicibacter algericus]OQZ96913.1 hypothetical protein BST10_10060 [Mycolicibacter algericus DSM 45454]GFG83393.1 hypothetical protein MALGJ_00690 [Mycolicibacter algericus]